MKSYEEAIKNRRSVYAISSESTITDDRLQEILHTALLYSPSAYNSQSPRAVLLLGQHHSKLWDIVMRALQKRVLPEKFPRTEEKINAFAAGYGTVLYFEDEAVTNELSDEFPSMKETFPLWALQHNGMFIYNVWTLLETEGLGASLQHYNPIIDEEVHREWSIPSNWKLLGQMPFGKPIAMPEPKEKQPVTERYLLFK